MSGYGKAAKQKNDQEYELKRQKEEDERVKKF